LQEREKLKKKLKEIEAEAQNSINKVKSLKGLENLRVKYLGKKGLLTEFLRGMGALAPAERPSLGKLANQAKDKIEELLRTRRKKLEGKEREARPEIEKLDLTLPGRAPAIGKKHPLTLILEEIKDIFLRLGFQIVEGPEVELEYYNFEALNTPQDHPARDEQDSFYIKDKVLLRTQTSPVQVRVMEKRKPPLRIIAPGKCYRRDAIDASHFPVFHQVEGLMVDEDITFGDLKGVLEFFLRQLFGKETILRFRPDFFPFTEPSADVSIACVICGGKGCSVCSQSGWLEILGAGMVDPEVFKRVNYDPEVYSGFAFGMGVERMAMLKYGIDDIRLFFANDMRFLSQF
jgi:phenylalanyl-tRNA synthetase alpha chain